MDYVSIDLYELLIVHKAFERTFAWIWTNVHFSMIWLIYVKILMLSINVY